MPGVSGVGRRPGPAVRPLRTLAIPNYPPNDVELIRNGARDEQAAYNYRNNLRDMLSVRSKMGGMDNYGDTTLGDVFNEGYKLLDRLLETFVAAIKYTRSRQLPLHYD